MKFPTKIKFNIKKGKFFLELIKKIPRVIGENFLLTVLILFLLSLLWGSLVFYKYAILAERTELQIIKPPLQLNERAYQRILSEWQKREEKLKETGSKEYSDPFNL